MKTVYTSKSIFVFCVVISTFGLFAFVVACTTETDNDNVDETPVEETSVEATSDTVTVKECPPLIPSDTGPSPERLPYIFKGNYFVDGEPGPPGVNIWTQLPTSRSGAMATLDDGRYVGVVHGPIRDADVGVPFIFCIGDPDGASVQAVETYDYDNKGTFHEVELELHFPKLPE